MLKQVIKQAGFTIVEMLIYMGLLGIFLVMLSTLFLNMLEAKADAQATSAVELDGRFIINRLAYDLSRATSVTAPAAIGGSGSTLTIVIGGVTNTYTLNAGNLVVTNNNGSIQLNSSETTIPTWSVLRIGNNAISGTKDLIQVNLTINSRTQRARGVETRNFQTTVGRR